MYLVVLNIFEVWLLYILCIFVVNLCCWLLFNGLVVCSFIVFVMFFLMSEVFGDLYIVVELINLDGYWLNLILWLLLVDICLWLFNVEKINLFDKLWMLILVVWLLVCIVEIFGRCVNVLVIDILGNVFKLLVDSCLEIVLLKCFWFNDWIKLWLKLCILIIFSLGLIFFVDVCFFFVVVIVLFVVIKVSISVFSLNFFIGFLFCCCWKCCICGYCCC